MRLRFHDVVARVRPGSFSRRLIKRAQTVQTLGTQVNSDGVCPGNCSLVAEEAYFALFWEIMLHDLELMNSTTRSASASYRGFRVLGFRYPGLQLLRAFMYLGFRYAGRHTREPETVSLNPRDPYIQSWAQLARDSQLGDF